MTETAAKRLVRGSAFVAKFENPQLDSTNGVVSFANSRTDAWHRLGQSVGHVMTASEALDAASLSGWAVRKMRLEIPQEPIITDDGVTTPPAHRRA